MASKPLDGPGLSMMGIGALLMFAGIKGYSLLALAQNLIVGRPITTNVAMTYPLTTDDPDAVDSDRRTGGGTFGGTPVPTSTKGNRALGQELAAARGWTGAEWTALEALWTGESNWNNRADNPSSHAYGIPQALPHTKMPKAAWPESAGGSSDARSQIEWGLSYIQRRYGSPRMAYAFWLSKHPHWY